MPARPFHSGFVEGRSLILSGNACGPAIPIHCGQRVRSVVIGAMDNPPDIL